MKTPAATQAWTADLDAFMDAKVAEIKKTCPGVPESVIRGTLMARSSGCLCQAYFNVIEQDNKQAETCMAINAGSVANDEPGFQS